MDVDLTGVTSVEDEVNDKSSAMDVDLIGRPTVKDGEKEKQSAIVVDLKGIPCVEDEGKGKDPPDVHMQVPIDFSMASLEKFCKEASRSFFSENGLASHQINSYNAFVSHGLQELFDSIGQITVEPDYDPSKKDGDWKHATIKFGRVELEEPVFMVENGDLEQQDLKLKPGHAHLQKMTYASRMNVEMTVQVYILVESEKAKTGKDMHVHRRDIVKETKKVSIGMLPMMVKSNLCWLHKLQESDCQFDYGGYFLIKGMEKLTSSPDSTHQLLHRELWVHVMSAKRRMVKLMQRDLSSDGNLRDLRRYVDASIITNGLNRAFSTGSWRHPYKRERCSGVDNKKSKFPPLMSMFEEFHHCDPHGQMMSDLRKTRQWFVYSGTTGDARYPNPSYWGKLCLLSTPDGEKCGFVKNLAVTAMVSSVVGKPSIDKLVSCGMKKLDDIPLQDSSGKDRIFLNGELLGVEIKRDKHNKEVRIFSDPGRILRPILVVKNLRRITRPKDGLYSFQELVDQNIIELIGVEEEEDIQCAYGIRHMFAKEKEERSFDYTHCELDPSFLLGLSCSLVPFANHDNARRVLMQAEKISQQSIGYSPTNYHSRLDTLSHQIFYPQRPLFKTMVGDCLGKADYSFGMKDDFSRPEYFNGQNAIVSVNVHQGFNQEDSLVFNRASLERGMFRTLHFKSYKAQVENKEITRRLKHRENINFGKVQSKRGRVDNLDNEGLPYVGASLQSGDIVIGKVTESGEDYSVKLMHTEKGMVEKVVLSANDDGVNFATVTIRQSCSPCVGDKFASMHGQKGVVGLLDSQGKLPIYLPKDNIVINPHGFPTRQTPGQLLEAALGKGIALGGNVRYATPFTTPSVDVITEQLHKAGFSRWGDESVLNGQTGEQMKSLVFIAPTFYQRLTKMAEDQVKLRNTGPVHPRTRQPVVDKKRFGGVKLGEMESDCLLGHGATANVHEGLFTLSDFSQIHICQTCERVANVIMRPVEGTNKKVHGPYCLFCRSAESIVCINVPYGAKVLYQELFSMGICLRFETE
ncbi:LOW QUALITY PROTEIN: hypothetical protein U9M48_040715, partial [Paspalum notatum var. saurae]